MINFSKSTLLACLLTTLLFEEAFTQEYDLLKIREKFFVLTFDSKEAPKFYEFLTSIEMPTPTIIAYKGATEALLTKHTWNPLDKMKYLKMSASSLESAVQSDSENIEVRFIRYAVERNIPRLLGFSRHMQEDEAMIVSKLSEADELSINPLFKKYILEFLIEKSSLSNQKIDQLRLALR